MANFFNEMFGLDLSVIEDYGALNVSLVADLPLFIDPFLLFNSKNPDYRQLHDDIIAYLRFLKGKSAAGVVSEPLLRSWYCFPEVRQNWLGFSALGNDGHGLGIDFARALHSSLQILFPEFGSESVTKGSHMEKVCLIKEGVGRDNISDFATNLIKGYLLRYTETFARQHLKPDQMRKMSVPSVAFDYELEAWHADLFELPFANGDYVLLTPRDLLTRDENWINRSDLVEGFERIPVAIPDQQLRSQISNYFEKVLARPEDREPNKKERTAAAIETIKAFPAVVDYYIRLKENQGDQAVSVSAEKVKFAQIMFNARVNELQGTLRGTDFYKASPTGTYAEAHRRLGYLKHVIEDQGGHRFFWQKGQPMQKEADLQVMFRLVWYGSPLDVATEANDGRGPADFKISLGAADKTIVEMKLAKNTQLKRNLSRQTDIYKKASDAHSAIKAIIYFSPEELARVRGILTELGMESDPDVVLIDARNDNKPSGSKAA
jgi:hypothetical protein